MGPWSIHRCLAHVYLLTPIHTTSVLTPKVTLLQMAKIRVLRFTLLELMVGMTILSILMLMLFQFLISSQRTLNWSDSMWRIYENSRIVFDLVERDLQACVVSSSSNSRIPFYIGDPAEPSDPDDAMYMCFVASTEPPDTNAKSRLCEISYRFHDSETAAVIGNRAYTLYRQIISDSDADADWDFYSSDTWYDNDDANTSSSYQKVVAGIKNFSVDFYFDGPNPIDPTGGIDTTVKPTSVRISFDLFDESLIDAPAAVQEQTLRGFYKDIDLKKIPSEH